jgi:FtsP/CotA-like multicopper oxidase with cupredoxin domain
METQVSRRGFLKWTGIVIAGAPVLAACSHTSTPHAAPAADDMAPPPVSADGTFKVGNKTYPYKDKVTGELLYHDPIRFAPKVGLDRVPLTAPADLLTLQPPRVDSAAGVLDQTLEIAFSDVVVNGQTVHLRTYNGTYPGPTLVAKPGDRLNLIEVDKLPPEAPMPMHDINHPHGFNDVNLHTHGMNVNPGDSEDNVFLEVHPGESFVHEIYVPSDHPTGTFWYHPHKHGGSACQVGSGMAGALLMTDPQKDIRSIPEIGAAKEVVLIFQELYIQDNPDGTGDVPGMPTDVDNYFYGDAIRTEQTVNGTACMELTVDRKLLTPELRMRPGEVQHWRLVHGGIFQNWPFSITGHKANIISYDAITIEKMETVDQFLFSSGQRRDILVQATMTPGTYPVKRKAYKQAKEVNTWPEITLFNLIVEGDPMAMALPAALNPPTKRLPYIADSEIVYKRKVDFSFIDDTANNSFLFTIDGKVFKPGRVDFSMVLGTAEEWTVTNNPDSDHPFHIHVNWFELLSQTDGAGNVTKYDPPIWMDTANIPSSGNIVIRMRFQEFQGQAVFHCHFLTHEDEGMMATIEIVDGSPKTETITSAGGTFVSQDYQNRVQMRFLPGSVPASTDVTYQYLASPDAPAVTAAPALPKALANFNTFFSLSAKQRGAAVAQFARPATVEVKYSSAQVDVNVPLDGIGVYHYDEGSSTWTTDGVSMISRSADLLVCSTAKLGTFAVSGAVAK